MPKVHLQILNIFLLLYGGLLYGQADSTGVPESKVWKHTSVQAFYQKGYVFATNDFIKGINVESARINGFQTFSLKLSTRSDGEKLWEQLYKYPEWGIGIYMADFFNPEEIGRPLALYGFFNAPLIRRQRLLLNYELGFGATFNWKSFNPVTNQYNIAIGAGESFIIDAGLNLDYQLTDRTDIIAGFSLTHFSNGALKKPNFGINTVAPKIGLKYNFYRPIKFIARDVPEFDPHNEWIISGFGGVKNLIFDSVNIDIIEKYEGAFFPVFGISAGYNRQVSYKSKIGIGMTLSFDGSTNARAAVENNEIDPVDTPFSDKIQLSIYPSYELTINRLSLVLQPAFYLYRKNFSNQSPAFHQRIGLKYQLTDKVFAVIILRDYAFHVSDHLEWTLGYRILTK
jgi:hypothetical protein